MERLFPLFLILFEFVGNLSSDMYLPALPEIAENLQTSLALVQFTVAAWLIGGASLLLLIGPLEDRFGGKKILIAGGLLFCISTLGCALAGNISHLIFWRIFQGLSVSATMIVAYATLNEIYDDGKATMLMAWMGISSIFSPLVGPLIGGVILLIAPWQAIFWTLFLIVFFNLFFLYKTFPKNVEPPSPDSLSLHHVFDVYKSILKSPRFIRASLMYGLGYSMTMSWIVKSPTLTMTLFGKTPLEYALWQVPIFTLFCLGTFSIKKLLRHYDREKIIRFFLVWAAVFSALLTLFSASKSFGFLIALVAFTLLGRGVTFAPMSRIALSTFTFRRGAATALFYFITISTGATVTTLLSALPNHFFALGMTFLLLSSGSILLSCWKIKKS